MKTSISTRLFVAGLVLALAAGPAAARIWYVPDEAPSIAVALDSADTGDIIEIACGTYYEHDLVLKAGVVVRSEDGVAACVTIDAQQQGQVLVARDLVQPAVLLGLTITGGVAPADDSFGGGIYCRDAGLNMAQCEVRGNYSEYSGGGLYAHTATLIFSSTVFAENETGNGGGGAARLYEVGGEFLDCRFEDNLGDDGAALYMSWSDLDLNFCTFLNNEGQFFGGAVFCVSNSEPLFNHCTMVGNSAHLGGGIMVAADSHPTIEACIIAFNHLGSGVDVNDEGSTVTIICSDIYGNEDGAFTGHIEDQIGLNGNIAVNPAFCDLEGGDLALASASPCLPLNNDCAVLMGAHTEGCVLTPVPTDLPTVARLAPNRPNPFNPRTSIGVDLASPMSIELAVHDLAGRRVSVLQSGRMQAGHHDFVWEGRDDRGRAQPSGTYLYRLRAGDRVETRSMVLVR